jgi:hypothetical protein
MKDQGGMLKTIKMAENPKHPGNLIGTSPMNCYSTHTTNKKEVWSPDKEKMRELRSLSRTKKLYDKPVLESKKDRGIQNGLKLNPQML